MGILVVHNPSAGVYLLFGICLMFENCLNLKRLLMTAQMDCRAINWARFKKTTANASLIC